MSGKHRKYRISYLLLTRHDLNLGPLAVEVIKLEFRTTSTNVVYASSKADYRALELATGGNNTFRSEFFNVFGDGHRDMELVGIGIRILSLLEVLNMSGTKFIVLL